jgi:CheY-like chemotaxis protein
MGVVLGVGNVGKLSVGAATDAVRAAVWATGQAGGDIAKVTRVAMEGAIEAGRQLGMSAEEVSSAAGAGALEAAAGLGDTAVKAVTKALSGTISGVRIALDAGIPKPKVLVVDTNRGSLESLVQQLAREDFRAIGASSVEELNHTMQANGSIALVLIDVSGFHEEIWACCDRLSRVKVPFVVVAPQRSPAILRDSMKHGASGVLTKPIAAKELAEHIRALVGD